MANHSALTNKYVSLWLGSCCILVLLIVWVGGITRLTSSGLSITEWKPIVGVIPPVNQNDWIIEKKKYESTPEYRQLNYNITMEEFKIIYLIEYFHRIIGRVAGIFFVVPFLYFVVKKKISKSFALRLMIVLVIGITQAFMGWYMVKSGLVDHPYVSHYRLTAHLMLAILILYLLWNEFLKYTVRKTRLKVCVNSSKLLFFFANIIPILIVIQIMFGGLVAGLKAGLIYNTYPLMEGQIIPNNLLFYDSMVYNIFNNHVTVQFIHRTLPILIVMSEILVLVKIRTVTTYLLLSFTILQFYLGVLTLLYKVPIILASLHQVSAFMLFLISTCLLHYFKISRVR